MAIKASLPKGTRDFGPEEVYKRNYIFRIIREVFEKYGYQPLETPAMENLETLTGKYGEEGDKLLFKVLNSGDFLNPSKISDADWEEIRDRRNPSTEIKSKRLAPLITEKGLRYDLTIPFARYVVQHQHEITFPFKRYQMQPVWRADRPQKGRYREFYQCDADVVGSDSLLNEVEMAQIYLEVFQQLGIDIELKINNRKILFGIAEALNIKDKLTDFTIALDKLDKIGVEGVIKEFEKRGIPDLANSVLEYIDGTNAEQLSFLKLFLQKSETGIKGINEIEFLLAPLPELQFNMTLARGLDYYTGIIFEVMGKGLDMGSLGGGGRYDDLTGVFGLEGVSGTGISFGVERIYDVMEELNLFENIDYLASTTKVLFINFGEESENAAFQYLQKVREEGISSELYPSPEKMKKQMKYADNKKIPYVIFIGEEEMKSGRLSMKDMKTGEQKDYELKEVIKLLK